MSVEEELHEHAENAKEPFDRKVALTMAIVAAGLAFVTVVGHMLSSEELLAQQKASDQWAFYQAKSIRRYDSEIARDMLTAQNAAAGVIAPYVANVERYEKETEEIQKEAKALEVESTLRGKQAFRAEAGEVFLEIGIVLASLAILTKRQLLWHACMLTAVVGLAVAATALMVT